MEPETLEKIAQISQIIKPLILVTGGGAIAYLCYRIAKEKKLLKKAQEELARAQDTLRLAENIGEQLGIKNKGTWKELQHYVKEEYPVDKEQLRELQNKPKRYQEGIFEVEKEVKEEGFSTYITKRTQGLVEAIEDSSKRYSAAASFVDDKEKAVSNIRIKTNNGQGVVEFPRQLSQQEKEAILNNSISYQEKYSCYDEGAYMGLLQGWHYNIEVLEGSNKGIKLQEDITV